MSLEINYTILTAGLCNANGAIEVRGASRTFPDWPREKLREHNASVYR